MKKFIIVYLLCAVISWFLISGWMFAESYAKYPATSIRKHSGFAAAWSVLAAGLWPIFLPGVYCITGYAEHGWRPVWNLEPSK